MSKSEIMQGLLCPNCGALSITKHRTKDAIINQIQSQLSEAEKVLRMMDNYKEWSIKPVAVNPKRLFKETSIYEQYLKYKSKYMENKKQ